MANISSAGVLMIVCRGGEGMQRRADATAGGDILEQDTARHAEKSEAGNVRRRRRNPSSAGNGGGILTTDSRTAGEYRCCHQYVNPLASDDLCTIVARVENPGETKL